MFCEYKVTKIFGESFLFCRKSSKKRRADILDLGSRSLFLHIIISLAVHHGGLFLCLIKEIIAKVVLFGKCFVNLHRKTVRR